MPAMTLEESNALDAAAAPLQAANRKRGLPAAKTLPAYKLVDVPWGGPLPIEGPEEALDA